MHIYGTFFSKGTDRSNNHNRFSIKFVPNQPHLLLTSYDPDFIPSQHEYLLDARHTAHSLATEETKYSASPSPIHSALPTGSPFSQSSLNINLKHTPDRLHISIPICKRATTKPSSTLLSYTKDQNRTSLHQSTPSTPHRSQRYQTTPPHTSICSFSQLHSIKVALPTLVQSPKSRWPISCRVPNKILPMNVSDEVI